MYVMQKMRAHRMSYLDHDDPYTQLFGPVLDGVEPVENGRVFLPDPAEFRAGKSSTGCVVTIKAVDQPAQSARMLARSR